MLTLLTATGARPEAWDICKRLMRQQTYEGPVTWIIIDDGEVAQPLELHELKEGWVFVRIRPQPFWEPGHNTQCRNLKLGLECIGDDARVVVIEDDDYYRPEYLATVDSWLSAYDLVGESHARYYNVISKRGQEHSNTQHSSLCSTAVKGAGLEWLRKAVDTREQFIDMWLWRNAICTKMLFSSQMVVGMKSLPGRGGIGMGHRGRLQKSVSLDSWIRKEDVHLYAGVIS